MRLCVPSTCARNLAEEREREDRGEKLPHSTFVFAFAIRHQFTTALEHWRLVVYAVAAASYTLCTVQCAITTPHTYPIETCVPRAYA